MQRLIELLDFSRRAPTVRGNEQLKTYLKTNPLPVELRVEGCRLPPLFWVVFTTVQREIGSPTARRRRTDVLRKTIDILLRAGAKIDALARVDTHFVDFVDHGAENPEITFNEDAVDLTMNALFYAVWAEHNMYYVSNSVQHRNDLVDILLRRGADPNKARISNEPRAGVNGKQKSALHVAAESRNVEGARLLIKYGANPNVRNDMGTTPLQIAARENQTEMIRLLLRAGASPKIANANGWTPLHYLLYEGSLPRATHAMRLDFRGRGAPARRSVRPSFRDRLLTNVRLLIQHGANPRAKDKWGDTPLDLLVKYAVGNRPGIRTELNATSRATARYALDKHLPDEMVQAIVHRAGLTNVNEFQGKRRNQEMRRDRRLIKPQLVKR